MDQEFINQLAEKLSKLGTKRPLGFHYAHPFGTVPPDSIICNGAEYNRALYADFFAYATEQGWVKTETEWQEIASQNNGYCSYYSDGDGSTTFRTPKFAPFMQVAISSGNVGSYHEAGLPNITGTSKLYRGDSFGFGEFDTTGAFYQTSFSSGTSYTGTQANNKKSEFGIDASRISAVYGRSTTVQPESSEWMICVVVFGIATNVGSADVGNVMSAVAQIQAELPNKLNNTTPHIVDTWKLGSNWYRVWSDGFIEQGGIVDSCPTNGSPVSLNTPFSSVNYSIVCSTNLNSPNSLQAGFAQAKPVDASSFTVRIRADNSSWPDGAAWHASGY